MNMLKRVLEKMDIMGENMKNYGNICKLEESQQEILELKNRICEVKISSDGINNSQHTIHEGMRKFENKLVRIIQMEADERKRLRKKIIILVTCGIALSSLTCC